MLKKNMRKRLLAGALATIMALTMCPTWALAGDEGITTLPSPEDQMSVVDSTSAEDAIQKTPDAETQGQTEPQDTAQAGQIENPDPAQAPSGGTDIEETGNNSNSNENDSQNNDAVSNSPANEIATTSGNSDNAVDVYANKVQTIEAEYWLTNRRAVGDDGNSMTINEAVVGDGKAVTELAPAEREATADAAYNTVFWQARVHASNKKQTDRGGDDKTAKGTEITNIRYNDGQLEYQAKDSSKWTAFAEGSQLVFYYLIRTEYSQMVQIDVSDWTVNAEPNRIQYPERRSVIYQVIIKDGLDAGKELRSETFWYNSAVNVSAVRVRQTETADYMIDSVVLDPEGLGKPEKVNGEYQFSLDLAKVTNDERNATVKIYVSATSHNLTYDANGGTLADGSYSKDKVYPKMELTLPTDAEITREGYRFDGWYDEANNKPYQTGDRMPNADLTLYAKWVKTAYNVTYYVDGVQSGDVEKYGYDEPVTIRPDEVKEGHTFSGWKIGEDVAEDFNMPAHNVIIEGSFTRNTYKVIYKLDGVEGDPTDYLYGDQVAIADAPAAREGYTFSGWKIGEDVAEDFNMPAHNVIIEGNFTRNTKHYTINKHFYNEKDVEVKAENGETKTGNEYALVAELYKDDAVNQTVDGKTYVYVPGLTKVTDNLEKLTKDVTIDLYYYLDVKGGEKPDETGNGTPDAWEYRLAFKVVNGEWNNGGNADIVVYVPFKDYKNGDELKYVVVPITRIPAVGDKPNSGYRAGSWDTTPVGNAKVEKDTVFTYTYAKKSSSGGGGGGGGRKPTVTIPDDVPTGLNGDDHYAYIVGYPDSTVRPQNGITRAEVATIFFRLLTDETRNANSTKANSYSDVAEGAWYNHAVSTLSAMGIVKGDSQGKFNPNAPITRAEFAAIAARFDDKANTTAVDFSDIVSHWAKDEISAAANNGWINGYTDGTFRPNNKITRAEAMTLVNRVLKRLPETAKDLHNDMIKWSDNSDTSAWYYLAVQEATNSHYYDIKGNKHEKWSKLRETRDWTELEK